MEFSFQKDAPDAALYDVAISGEKDVGCPCGFTGRFEHPGQFTQHQFSKQGLSKEVLSQKFSCGRSRASRMKNTEKNMAFVWDNSLPDDACTPHEETPTENLMQSEHPQFKARNESRDHLSIASAVVQGDVAESLHTVQ